MTNLQIGAHFLTTTFQDSCNGIHENMESLAQISLFKDFQTNGHETWLTSAFFSNIFHHLIECLKENDAFICTAIFRTISKGCNQLLYQLVPANKQRDMRHG